MGVSGVVSNAAIERGKEAAIRMAFGARAESVTWMVFKQGLALALAGAAIGIGAGVFFSRLLAAPIPEVQSASPWMYFGAVAFLAAAAIPACYFPARRAAMADPAETLRAE